MTYNLCAICLGQVALGLPLAIKTSWCSTQKGRLAHPIGRAVNQDSFLSYYLAALNVTFLINTAEPSSIT